MRKMLLSAAMLLPAAAFAAPAGVALTHNGAVTTFHGAPSKQTLPRWTPPAGRIVIFNTLGKKPYNYNSSTGWTVSNPGSDAGTLQWFAFAVTPTKSATVTEILEAVSNVTGPNSVTVALLADNGGVPGNVLQQKTVKNLQSFGGCCTVAVDHVKTGVKVTAGTTYWVAAILPSKKQSTTFDAWNFSSANTGSGNAAYYNGTWNPTTAQYAAFAIFGK